MSDIKSKLSAIPLFSGISDNELSKLEQKLVPRTFQAGETVFLVGDPGESMYMVEQGRIEIFLRDHSGNRVTLTTIESGGFFGELALLDGGPRSASAMAIEPTQTLLLKHVDFETFLDANHSIAINLVHLLTTRLRATDELVRSLKLQNINEATDQRFSWAQRSAINIAEYSGSLLFFWSNMLAFAAWIILNTNIIPGFEPFDPYPFGFLTMAVSLEAIFLSILVLLSQNLQSKRDQIKNDIEYEINMRAELEVSQLHGKVDLMYSELAARLHRIEREVKK
jgi:CRP/FNR family cyclic AMP-dependent transcriptional regulator